MEAAAAADARCHPQTGPATFGHRDVDDAPVVHHTEVDRLAELPAQLVEQRLTGADDVEAAGDGAAEIEQLERERIPVTLRVAADVPGLPQDSDQAEGHRLVQRPATLNLRQRQWAVRRQQFENRQPLTERWNISGANGRN